MNSGGWLHTTLFKSTLIVVIAITVQFIALWLIGYLVRKLVKQSHNESTLDVKKRQDTLIVILRTTSVALIWLSVIIAILSLLGVNVAALLTGAGIIGVFFGLSAQNTVKDLLAGTFLLFEKSYRVGDTVSMMGGTIGVPGVTGKVDSITLRITRLRDMNGNLVTVRNGEPTIIKNETFSYSSIVLDFTITYESDIEAFKRILNEIGAKIAKHSDFKKSVKEPIRFLRVDDFAGSGVVVRAIGKVTPASQWDVAGEFRQELLVVVGKNPKINFAHS